MQHTCDDCAIRLLRQARKWNSSPASCADVIILPHPKFSPEKCWAAMDTRVSSATKKAKLNPSPLSIVLKQSQNLSSVESFFQSCPPTDFPLPPPTCYEGQCLNGGVCDGRKCKCRRLFIGMRCEKKGESFMLFTLGRCTMP